MPPDTRRQDSPLVAVIRLRPVIPFQYGPRIHNSVPDPRRLLVFGPIMPYTITTPEHGTAFDIAGKGIAKTKATEEAIRIAAQMAASRA